MLSLGQDLQQVVAAMHASACVNRRNTQSAIVRAQQARDIHEGHARLLGIMVEVDDDVLNLQSRTQ